jgi:thiamine pyrophosphokinase
VIKSNGICHIIGAGDFYANNFYPAAGDLIIAADGGLKWLNDISVKPDYMVGDFDSYPEADICKEITVIRLEREKDETDMLCAIRLGQEKGYGEFHIHGGTSGRPDHTFANIQCLISLSRQSASALLFFENYYLTAITNKSIKINGNTGETISIFAYGGQARDVTITGLKYNLINVVFSDDYPIGQSNEFTCQTAEISVENGMLLIVAPISAKVEGNIPYILFSLMGEVVSGKGKGRTVGIPTINLQIGNGAATPVFGVYATIVHIDDNEFYGVTNVGHRPSVDQSNHVTVETFIMDFDGDLYGKAIKLDFYKFLRDTMKFGSLDDVKYQVIKDCESAMEYFDKNNFT